MPFPVLVAAVALAAASPCPRPSIPAATAAATPAPQPCASPTPAPAEIGRTVARGRSANLIGTAPSSSSGIVSQAQVEVRPLQRPADVLETIPGVVISQHSGEGKANQYYVRGFNLDHGTDLASSVAGLPVNMPTHAHGQGYSDLNWMIPELVSYAEYKKGPYFADEGDFSTAGAINIFYRNTIASTALAGGGSGGNSRLFVADSPRLWGGNLLYGIEYFHNDNSFELPDNYRRYNGVLRYSRVTDASELAVTGTFYRGTWSSTDQIPQRAVESGRLPLYGNVDPSDGGTTHHYGVSATYEQHTATSATRYALYGLDYGLDLFSNFTYNLDDPVNGDQINQVDKRFVFGGSAARDFVGAHGTTTIGVGFRNDNISTDEINHTRDRVLIAPAGDPNPADVRPVTDDHVAQLAYFAYAQHTFRFGPKLRVVPGLRADLYTFHVLSDEPANSGFAQAGIVSPKLEVAYAASPHFEAYFNAGDSFHSNDGRGTTVTHDPVTHSAIDASGAAVQRVTPLARAKGLEVGARYTSGSVLNATLTLWQLDIASELTFDGDHGTTSAGYPTRRKGIEVATFFHPTKRLTFDLDYADSSARYTRFDPAFIPGSFVAGSLAGVTSSGVTYDPGPYFGSLRYRYFGPRALIEDNSVRSAATKEFNLLLGSRPRSRSGFGLQFEVLNLFNGGGNDVAYYYASRLKGETVCPDGSSAIAGCNDVHFHPLDKRGFRISISQRR